MPYPTPAITFDLRCHEDSLRIRWSVFDRAQPVLLSNGNRVPAYNLSPTDDIEVCGIRYEVVGCHAPEGPVMQVRVCR